MRSFRSRRLPAACRLILVIFALCFAAPPALGADRAASGTVVDQDGRPVPRALRSDRRRRRASRLASSRTIAAASS